jgi:TetR/AcrR family transcriptional repressor of bet genes
MSSALAHHYFGGKEQIFIAAMRHILRGYGQQVRTELQHTKTPRTRIQAIIRASFAPDNFRAETISAWMNFYVMAQNSVETRRLLTVYQRRLNSNLLHNLRPLVGDKATEIATNIAALIDGLYIRMALNDGMPDGQTASKSVLDQLDLMLSYYCSPNNHAGGKNHDP